MRFWLDPKPRKTQDFILKFCFLHKLLSPVQQKPFHLFVALKPDTINLFEIYNF